MILKAKYLYIFCIVGIMLIPAAMLHAQNVGEEFREKIEKIKLEKLIKRLDLDESTAKIFTQKYKEFADEIRDLNQQRLKAYKLMTENLESGSGLDTLVDRVLSIEDQINQKRMDFAAELKTMLTPKQIATMIVFERRFNTIVRGLIQNYLKEKKDKKQNQNN